MLVNHHDLACLSSAIYLDRHDVDSAVRSLGWDVDWFGDHADTQAMLCTNGKVEALVFRGTEFSKGSISDLWSNVGSSVRWAGPGKVHSGYLSHFNRIAYKACERVEKTGLPTVLTGHSLGGAVATIAALYLKEIRKSPAHALVTFGAPRSLDAEACEHLTTNMTRYRVNGDLATTCPPWRPSAALKMTHPCPSTDLPAREWWHGPYRRHSIDAYISAIEKGGN